MTRPRRSKRADGELTRQRILDAAGPLYAAGGFAETTSKAIAARAGVDLASINYHFGSRNGLYQATLVDAHGRLVNLERLQAIAASPGPPSARLAQFIDMIVEAATGTEGWPAQLLAREVLAPSSNLSVLFESALPPKLTVLAGILSELTGIPKEDPALLRCMLSIGAPCLFMLVAAREFPGPVRLLRAMPREAIAEHMKTFALGGLAAVARDHAARNAGPD